MLKKIHETSVPLSSFANGMKRAAIITANQPFGEWDNIFTGSMWPLLRLIVWYIMPPSLALKVRAIASNQKSRSKFFWRIHAMLVVV